MVRFWRSSEGVNFWGGSDHTILFGSDAGAPALRTRTNIGMGFNPNLVLCPLLQALQDIAGHISWDILHFMTLLVLARDCLIGQSVAHNVPIATGSRGRHPTHLDACRAEAKQVHFLWRGGRSCGVKGVKKEWRNSGLRKPLCTVLLCWGQFIRNLFFVTPRYWGTAVENDCVLKWCFLTPARYFYVVDHSQNSSDISNPGPDTPASRPLALSVLQRVLESQRRSVPTTWCRPCVRLVIYFS